jgi:hypothetical protein
MHVFDSIAGAGKVAMEVKAQRRWIEVVILRFSLAICNPGCLHLVLESVSPKTPTSWRTELPIPSNIDKLALVRPSLPSIWHTKAVSLVLVHSRSHWQVFLLLVEFCHY